MRVFIAGATGVLGRRVVPQLVERGYEVTAVGRTHEKRERLEAWGARPVGLDLFDSAAVLRAVSDAGADAIVNLATAVPPAGFGMLLPWAWREMDRVRRVVSSNLAEAALTTDHALRVVQESFAPIYADGGDEWLDEAADVRPARYNRAALEAEAQAQRLTAAGRTGVVLRFAYMYGPHDPVTDRLVDGMRRGWFPLFGAPDAYGSWIHHDDAAAAVLVALGLPAGVYNVVEDEPSRRREVANAVAEALRVRPPRFMPGWTALLGGSVARTLARSLRISNRRLRETSDWAPRYPTTMEGLKAVIAE